MGPPGRLHHRYDNTRGAKTNRDVSIKVTKGGKKSHDETVTEDETDESGGETDEDGLNGPSPVATLCFH